nr:LysR family transcriptional regulator [uncultured Roseateles sp.]
MPSSPSVLFARLTAKARLKHLQLLVHIGDLHNLKGAAAAVGMSQPAATHALAELESLLGVALFERHSRGMRPTTTGKALLPAVRDAMRSMQECADAVATAQAGASALVKVGAIGAGISGVLVRVLPAFSERHPEVVVEVAQIEAEDLLEDWDRRSLDLLLCRQPAHCPSDSAFLAVASDRYCVVGRPTHALAGRRGVSSDQLAACTWLMQPPRSIASRDFYRLWEGAEMNPQQRWVNGRSLLLLLAMLQQQELLAFLPYNSVRQLIENGLLAEIDAALLSALPPIGLLYRPADLESNPPARGLADAIAAVGDLSAPGPVG